MADLVILEARSEFHLQAVRGLWREYWDSFGLSEEFQGFGDELKGLPGVYGQAGGVLLAAWMEDQAVGTIALRRLDECSGEVKRLYLRPGLRGHGLGRRLLEAVIERAQTIKYDTLYADTLPSMQQALSLYAKFGFERVPPYSNTPTAGAIFLKKQLVSL